MSKTTTYVEVEIVKIVAHTEKALLARVNGDTEVWVAYSLIRELEDMLLEEIDEALGDLEVITIPEWVAVQRGLV